MTCDELASIQQLVNGPCRFVENLFLILFSGLLISKFALQWLVLYSSVVSFQAAASFLFGCFLHVLCMHHLFWFHVIQRCIFIILWGVILHIDSYQSILSDYNYPLWIDVYQWLWVMSSCSPWIKHLVASCPLTCSVRHVWEIWTPTHPDDCLYVSVRLGRVIWFSVLFVWVQHSLTDPPTSNALFFFCCPITIHRSIHTLMGGNVNFYPTGRIYKSPYCSRMFLL